MLKFTQGKNKGNTITYYSRISRILKRRKIKNLKNIYFVASCVI